MLPVMIGFLRLDDTKLIKVEDVKAVSYFGTYSTESVDVDVILGEGEPMDATVAVSVNGQVYSESGIQLEKPFEKSLCEEIEKIVRKLTKNIAAAQEMYLPLISGNYRLDYVDPTFFLATEEMSMREITDNFVEANQLERVPQDSLMGAEFIIYEGFKGESEASASFGLEVIDGYGDGLEVNLYIENNGSLDSKVVYSIEMDKGTCVRSFLEYVISKG